MEDNLNKLKEKYENNNENVLLFLDEKFNQLVNVLEKNFSRLNENIITTSIILSKLYENLGKINIKNLDKINKEVKKFENDVNGAQKSIKNLARVVTTANGTYVKMYRTVDSYYIVYKTLLNQLKNFSTGLDAAIIQLKDFNLATYLVDAFRVKLTRYEAALQFFANVINSSANILEEFVEGNNKKIKTSNSMLEGLKEVFKAFWLGTEKTTKKIKIFGNEIELNFIGVRNIFTTLKESADRLNKTLNKVGKNILNNLINPQKLFKNIEISFSKIPYILGSALLLFTQITKIFKFSGPLLFLSTLAAVVFSLKIAFGNLLDVIMKFNIGGIQTFIIETVALIKNFFYDVTIYMLNTFKKLKLDKDLREFFGSLFELFKTIIEVIWPILKIVIVGLTALLKGLIIVTKPLVTMFTILGKILAAILNILTGNFDEFLKILNELVHIVLTPLQTTFSSLMDIISTGVNIFKELFNIVEKVIGVIGFKSSKTNPDTESKYFQFSLLPPVSNLLYIYDFLTRRNLELPKLNVVENDRVESLQLNKNVNISHENITNKNIQPVFNISIYTTNEKNTDEIVNLFRNISRDIFGQ